MTVTLMLSLADDDIIKTKHQSRIIHKPHPDPEKQQSYELFRLGTNK